jgi:magnesium chelatase subunit D
VLRVERIRDPQRRPLLVVVTDGRATGVRGDTPLSDAHAAAGLVAAAGVASVVVDCETGPVRLGLAGTLGALLGGPTLTMADLAAETLTATVRGARMAA